MPPSFTYFVQCFSAAFGSEKSANADASVVKPKDPSLRDFKDPGYGIPVVENWPLLALSEQSPVPASLH